MPQPELELELLDAQIDASIVDVYCSVTLTQRFYNPKDTPVQQIVYLLGMVPESAVYAFEMIRQNGTKVIGLAKAKDVARQELQAARAAGLTAALGEEPAKDVFSIELANIAPKETITVKVSYLGPLSNDEQSSQLVFTVPRTYMQRQRAANTPEGIARDDIPFTMNVTIQQAEGVERIDTMPGYQVTRREIGRRPAGITSGSDEHFASVSVTRAQGAKGPDADFILTISTKGLDSPRAFVEPHPELGTTAVGLTLVPPFKPIDTPLGVEYIALVDLSNNMADAKLEVSKEVLQTLLKGLPVKNSSINIFSYGTTANPLWPQSQPYNQANVTAALSHIKAMQANQGTTDVAKALGAVFNSLPPRLTRPVAIILLTGGGTWDVNACATQVRQEIAQRSSADAFLRLFTVGVGNEVPTSTCERIAQAGRGLAVHITEAEEPWLGKIARIIRAARQSPITNVRVNWDGAENSLVNSKDQAPYDLPGLFPGSRFQAYSILPKGADVGKRPVLVTAKVGSHTFTLSVPVRNMASTQNNTAVLHKVAARAIINEYEQGLVGVSEAEVKQHLIRLGTIYGLANREVSFIAVDNGKPAGASSSWDCTMPPPGVTRNESQSSSGTRGSGGVSAPADDEDVDGPVYSASEVLARLILYQGFDGGFGAQAHKVFDLLNELGGESAQEVFMNHRLSPDIAGVLLAWAWLNKFCLLEGLNVKEKLDVWLHDNAKIDVDAVQKEILGVVSFDEFRN